MLIAATLVGGLIVGWVLGVNVGAMKRKALEDDIRTQQRIIRLAVAAGDLPTLAKLTMSWERP
jgi:hypothetical protein